MYRKIIRSVCLFSLALSCRAHAAVTSSPVSVLASSLICMKSHAAAPPHAAAARRHPHRPRLYHASYTRTLLHAAAAKRLKAPHGKPLWLPQMLALTYNGNPQILAARAALRGVDETYAQAAAGFRPSLTGSASDQVGTQTDNTSGTVMNSPKILSLQVSQPLFNGGTTLAEMAAAKKRVLAQRATLHATTQKILLHALTAFMNVRRDRWIVRLMEDNADVLVRQLKAARERLRGGAITVTDLQQAETRLSGAIAERTAADARLKDSVADFENVVGIAPPRLRMHRIDIKLPPSLPAAVAVAEKSSPDIALARFALQAAHEDRKALSGDKWPQVSLVGQVDRTYDSPVLLPSRQADSASVMITATIPFYEGGKTDSGIRQAEEIEQQKNMNLFDADRAVRQSVVQAWESLATAKDDISVRRMQVHAAGEARGGVKAEAKFGMRTTLDILNAEQEYLNAQVAYASVIHDRDVAIYTLLGAMGKLTPATLNIPGAYDPAAHFKTVRNKWFGTDADGRATPNGKSDL